MLDKIREIVVEQLGVDAEHPPLPALHLPWQALPLLLLKLPVDPWS